MDYLAWSRVNWKDYSGKIRTNLYKFFFKYTVIFFFEV